MGWSWVGIVVSLRCDNVVRMEVETRRLIRGRGSWVEEGRGGLSCGGKKRGRKKEKMEKKRGGYGVGFVGRRLVATKEEEE